MSSENERQPMLGLAELKAMHGKDYVSTYENKPIGRLKRLEKFLDLKRGATVVDFACGNAMLLELVGSSAGEYHGVDFSPEMIAAARRRAARLGCERAHFHETDIGKFSEQNPERFDAAFAMDFSEHVYDEDWLEILKSIRRTLKPGGTLYLHTPNANYFIEVLKDKGILKQFPEHIAVRNAEQNVSLLVTAGFRDIDVHLLSHYEWRQKPFALLGYIPGIGKYFKARIFIRALR